MKNLIRFFAVGVIVCFYSVVARAGAHVPPPPPIATASQANAYAQLNAWGTSLTQQNQDGSGLTTWNALANTWDVPITNGGEGGQLSTQISMRQGGTQTTLTFSGNVLVPFGGPGSGPNGSTVTAINNVALAGTSTAQSPDYRLLSTAANDNLVTILGTVCGIHGTLFRTASGGPPSTVETYKFVPDVELLQSVTCAAQSVFTPDAALLAMQPAFLEMGRNDYASSTNLLAAYTASRGLLTAANYLCLTILNGEYPTEQSGQTGYNEIVADNTAIASNCGVANTWDWRSYLVSQYNASNPVDVLDHTNDIVPYTLRAVTAVGTLTSTINSSATTFSVTLTSGTAAGADTIWFNDGTNAGAGEYVWCSAAVGSTYSTCTRNFGTSGPGAIGHTGGAAVIITNAIHLSGTTNANIVAPYIAANYRAILWPNLYLGASPQTFGVFAQNVAPLGSPSRPTVINGSLDILGLNFAIPLQLPYGGNLSEFDVNGNPVSIAVVTNNNNLQIGSKYAQTTALCTGGAVGCAITATNNGDLQIARGLASSGTAPTLTGSCTSSAVTGGAFTGSFTTTCTTQTIIMTFPTTATHEWNCFAEDLTTGADLITLTGQSNTTCTFTATTGAGDTILYIAGKF